MADKDQTPPVDGEEPSWGPGAPSSDGRGGMREAVEGAKAVRDKLREQGGGGSRG